MYKRWPEAIKEKVKKFRTQGYSYGELNHEFNIPKSTLHQWVSGIKRPDKFTKQDRIRWIKKIQPLGALANKQKREKFITALRYEISNELIHKSLSLDTKKAILSMLYWAEGAKGHDVLMFANTDPKLILLFTTLLRQCYKLDESKFRIRLHLHWYHKEGEIKKFWSSLLGVSRSQFTKTFRKKRSKEKTFRKNFGGICFLKYNSVRLKDRIIEYAFALGEKITGKVNVPVA